MSLLEIEPCNSSFDTVWFHDAYQARIASPSSDGAGSISEVRTLWGIKFQIIG